MPCGKGLCIPIQSRRCSLSSLLLLKWLALAGTPAFDAGCHATLHLLIPTTHFAIASHASLTVSPRMLSHSACGGMLRFACWAEARIKIARMTLTIKLDRNWSSFQLANSAPPLSATDSAIAPSARMCTPSEQVRMQCLIMLCVLVLARVGR